MDDLEPAITTMQDRGFWAAYDNVPSLRRILIETCAAKFVERLRELHARGEILGQVCIETATEQKFLCDPEWEERVRTALGVIMEAEERGDEKVLRRFRGFVRLTGNPPGPRTKRNPPGPRTKRQTHRNMIEVIKRLEAGEDVKNIAGADEKYKLARTLHTNLRRFCLEVYDEWMLWSLLNPPNAPERYNKLIEKHLVQSCDFDLPAERSLASLAFNRAKQQYHASDR
jgi:hypothetical protein